MSESATPLKSIYAKNHNMFMNAVPDARDGMDRNKIETPDSSGGDGTN